MSRDARKQSLSGFYHVIMRGTGRQTIFETEQDREYFLSKAGSIVAEDDVEIHAYALMSNHLHLLLRDRGGNLARFMRRLGTSYSMHYNSAYGHVGHVFQGRYLSEPIEDDAYYLTALRYVIQNPARAGLGKDKRSAWTSYDSYFAPATEGLVETSFVLALFSGKDELRSFLDEPSEDACLEPSPPRLSDRELREAICRVARVDSPVQIKGMGQPERDAAITAVMALGASERRVERETGISRAILRRVAGRGRD